MEEIKLNRGRSWKSSEDTGLVEHTNTLTRVTEALNAGRLYARYDDGERAGSIAQVKIDPKYNRSGETPKVKYNRPWHNQDAYWTIEWCLFGLTKFKGRKNSFQISSHDSDITFLIGGDIETVWAKVDYTAKLIEAQENPNQKDIDGNVLSVGDSVLYINARYGSAMTLTHGVIKEFKVTVNFQRVDITTIIKNSDGELSKITKSEDMIWKRV